MFMKRLQQFFILAACLLVIAVAAVQRDGRLWGIPLSDTAKSAARNQADTLRVLDDGTVVISTAGLAKGVKGFGGPVPLEIYLKKGRVQQVKALHNSESPDFFQEASVLLSRWNGKTPEQALAMKVDGVSGATYSSKALIENVQTGLKYYKEQAKK